MKHPAILQPMLAASAETEEDIANLLSAHGVLYMSEKIDGIRCIKGSDGILYARSGKPINNIHIQKAAEHIPKGFDMEVTFHIDGSPASRPSLELVESVVNSRKDEWPRRWSPAFYVFDFQCVSLSFRKRYLILCEKYAGLNISNMIIHRQIKVRELQSILSFFGRVEACDGEGIVLRNGMLGYKEGRSTLREAGLVRYKRISTDIATIIGFEPLEKHTGPKELTPFGYAKRDSKASNLRTEEKIGAFICEHPVYGQFKVGSGMTDKQRVDYYKYPNHQWSSGKMQLRFFFRDTTHLNKPRNATFDQLL